MRRIYVPSYASSSYDDDGCLKPPLLLWLAIIYLSRAFLLPLAMGIGHVAGVDSAAMAVIRGLWSAELLLPSLIAVPVLYAILRRVPSASGMVRAIWSRGRIILALSAAADIGSVLVSSPIREGVFDDQALLSLFLAAIDLYFLLYLLLARRVRDTFADFPPRLA